jgi:hypothetical protein
MQRDFLSGWDDPCCRSTAFLGSTDIAEGLSKEALYMPFLPLTHLCPQQTWTSDMKEHEYKSDISKN